MTMNMHPRYRGFSLVEVLFAVFILSVGILGIISLQLFAKQNNYDAIQRTTAAALATNILERMRVNPKYAVNYISSVEPVQDSALPANTCPTAGSCTPAALASEDLKVWYALITGATEKNTNLTNSGGLLLPSACITQDPLGIGNTNQYRVAIAWRGKTALSSPVSSNCGAGAAGTPYGANNEYRRVYFIDATIE